MNKEALRAAIGAKLAAADLSTNPFPHLIIENFFPEDVYAKIMAYNPFKKNRGLEWQSKATSKTVSSATPYFARKQINFHPKRDTFDAPAEEMAFWNELVGALCDDNWLDNQIEQVFPAYFDIRFGDLLRDKSNFRLFKREMFLQRHEPGYYIGPHTDVPCRVFTCLFSFAEREGFEEYGTHLLRPKNPAHRCWGNDHYGFEKFEVAKVSPYRPNNFMLFFKTRQSFHAVKAITDEVPNQRYGMQYQFYEPSGGVFQDLSAPDIMRIKRLNVQTPFQKVVRRLADFAKV